LVLFTSLIRTIFFEREDVSLATNHSVSILCRSGSRSGTRDF